MKLRYLLLLLLGMSLLACGRKTPLTLPPAHPPVAQTSSHS